MDKDILNNAGADPSAMNPRIGVDFHTFDGLYQGSRSHILGLFSEAIVLAPGFEFVFFLEDTDRLKAEYPVFDRPNVDLVRIPASGGLMRLGFWLPLLRRRHRIDLLHTQYRLPFIRLGACAVTIHDVLFESFPEFFSRFFVFQSKLSFRHAARNSDLLFTVSNFSRGDISERYGIPSSRISVTYNGVDGKRFFPGSAGADTLSRYALESGRFALTVGRLEPRKNHENLFRAYARLGPSAWPLVVVGQKDFGWERLFDLVRELGLVDKVRFLEAIGDQELPDLMRHCGVFVYPAYAEGFGMPVAEAMASGCAVITSDTTSLPEVGGDAALYCRPDDFEKLAELLEGVMEDAGLRASLGEKGVLQVQKFRWEESARVLIDRYQSFFGVPPN